MRFDWKGLGCADRRHEPARAGDAVRSVALVVVVAAHVTLIDRLLTKQKGFVEPSRATRASQSRARAGPVGLEGEARPRSGIPTRRRSPISRARSARPKRTSRPSSAPLSRRRSSRCCSGRCWDAILSSSGIVAAASRHAAADIGSRCFGVGQAGRCATGRRGLPARVASDLDGLLFRPAAIPERT